MKKTFLALLLIFLGMHSYAQDAQALVAAEKAFENECLSKGIRDGFLSFVDSNAVEFNEKGPVNGMKLWLSIPAFDGVFTWSPAIAEISASGDWGYTSGNYEHRPKSLSDTPDQYGQYTTVWQKDPRGQWKYVIDFGNPHPKAALEKKSKIISVKIIKDQNGGESSLMEMEKSFIQNLHNDFNQAYKSFVSDYYHLNLSGFFLIGKKGSAMGLLKSHFPQIEYRPAGIKMSTGKDMAAIYGTLSSAGKTGSYLRIWRHERDGWKIALEVVRI